MERTDNMLEAGILQEVYGLSQKASRPGGFRDVGRDIDGRSRLPVQSQAGRVMIIFHSRFD